jgi:F-type H+-transporting ATPase subunit gamma
MAGARDLVAVVRSMKAVAASSIGQYERAVESLQDYRRTVELGLSACLRDAAPVAPAHEAALRIPLRAPIAAILIGSDQGLVGRFNEALMDFAASTLASLSADVKQVWAVGERMRPLISDAVLPLGRAFAAADSVEAVTALTGELLVEIAAARRHARIAEVYLFHNRPGPSASYAPVATRLLPFDASWQKAMATLAWPTKSSPQIMGEDAPALAAFIQEYLFLLLFQACAESLAAENASRLAAMQRAERNIEEILDGLTRRFHRDRQKSIDEELFEVVSGYESLSQTRTSP